MLQIHEQKRYRKEFPRESDKVWRRELKKRSNLQFILRGGECGEAFPRLFLQVFSEQAFATDQVEAFEFSTPLTMASSSSSSSPQTFAAFSHIISPLLLRALADLGFARPTLVQQKAIPLALENRDVLARARTGSGKTAAYCIPLVQKILNAKAVGTFPPGSNPPVK